MIFNSTFKSPGERGGHVADELSAFLDGELNANARQAVELHLEGCADCTRQLETLRMSRQMLREMAPAPMPRSFILSPEMVAPKRAERPSLALSFLPRLRLVTATMAVVLAVVLSADLLNLPPTQSPDRAITSKAVMPYAAENPAAAGITAAPTTAVAMALGAEPAATTAAAAPTGTASIMAALAAPATPPSAPEPSAAQTDITSGVAQAPPTGGGSSDTAGGTDSTGSTQADGARSSTPAAESNFIPPADTSTNAAGVATDETGTIGSGPLLTYGRAPAAPDLVIIQEQQAAPHTLSWLWLEIPLGLALIALIAAMVVIGRRASATGQGSVIGDQ